MSVPTSDGDPVYCDTAVASTPQSVLAATLEAYIAIDESGRVTGWNPAATSTFGWPREQACGRDLADLIIPERLRPAHRAALARLVEGGQGTILDRRVTQNALHRDGHQFPIEIALSATGEPGRRTYHCLAHDVTAATRARRFIQVEAAVNQSLAEAHSSTTAATGVVDALGAHMRWPVAELWLADDTTELLICTARYARPGLDLGDFAVNDLEPGIGLPGRVYRNARPLWIPDLSADAVSVRSHLADKIGLRVAVGVPIATGHRAIGALCIYGHQAEDSEDTLTGLLGGLAARVGQFLERRRAEELTVELARTKEDFVALVTHELRNPLTVITTTAEMLDEELPELTVDQARHHLAVIARNAQRLAVMAGDLLDLSSLESGQISIKMEPCDLRDILDEAVTAVTAAAVEKSITIVADVSAALPLTADPHRLRQVADNLLSNAVKYTPAHGHVTVTAHRRDDGIVWSVADTGIGIPKAERPRLFRRFYRASTAIAHKVPGTGLGLVVTRTILDQHHGTITVADTDTPGTTFQITLPIAAASR